MKKLENDVAVMQDRLEAVQDEADRLEKVLASLSEELENNPPTTPEEVHQMNLDFRGIDSTTDVLSFPAVPFEEESDFSAVKANESDYLDPDTGALQLGDIVINAFRVWEQAEEYGHSPRREFAFLVAHSMLHLCGYDHMTPEEARRMEARQEAVLLELGIPRE